jgi:hypothetical protein
MARRKRKDEPDWAPPAFDEVTYMQTEIAAARVAVITIGWAFVGAAVSFFLSFNAALAFLAGIAVAFGLYFVLPLIGIDIKPFKRRDWAGHGVTYFFSWLAFWILFLNPPFGDFADPTIQGMSASPFHAGYAGKLLCVAPDGGTAKFRITPPNDTVLVLFRATDNVGLGNLSVAVVPAPPVVSLTPGPPPRNATCPGSTGYPEGTYSVTFAPAGVPYTVTIVAVDRSGRQVAASFRIEPS